VVGRKRHVVPSSGSFDRNFEKGRKGEREKGRKGKREKGHAGRIRPERPPSDITDSN